MSGILPNNKMRGSCRHPTCCCAWISPAPCLSCGLCVCVPCLCACLYVCECLRHKGEINLFSSIGEKKKKKFLPNVYIWESSFYIRLPTLVDLEVPFVCSSRMLTQADREGKKKHPPHFFYISPCCWKSHSNYCPSVSHISCSWPQSPWRSTSIFILQGTPAWGVLEMVFLYLRICHNITVIFKIYPHNIHLLKYATQK